MDTSIMVSISNTETIIAFVIKSKTRSRYRNMRAAHLVTNKIVGCS